MLFSPRMLPPQARLAKRRRRAPKPCLEALETRLVPVNFTWNPTSGTNWSNPANWSVNGTPANAVPGAGDVAVFDGTVSTADANIDTPFAVTGVAINGSYAGSITDQAALTLGTFGYSQAGGTFTVNTPTVTVGGNWSLTGGTFAAGGGAVVFNGAGTQTLDAGGAGFFDVTHSGNGTLQLVNHGLSVIDVLRISGGTFDANGQSVTVTGATVLSTSTYKGSTAAQVFSGGLVLTNAILTTANTGLVTLGGDVTETPDATGHQSAISGNLSLGGATRTFTLTRGSGTQDLAVSAVISGQGGAGLTEAGNGVLLLSAANTYAGGATVNGGTLAVDNGSALGTGTLSLNGGVLRGNGTGLTLANPLNLGGNAVIGGTTDLTLTGTATSVGNPPTGSWTLTVTNTGLTTLAGAIGQSSSSSLGLAKGGTGTLLLSGANTYSGGTTLNVGGGTLALGNAGALGSGGLTLNGGVLRGNGTALTLANPLTFSGDFTVGGNADLTFTGPVMLAGGRRTLTVANTGLTTLAGGIGQTTLGLTKAGPGILALAATEAYAGTTVINAGTLWVNGSLTSSAITVNAGATLGGAGTVGTVTVAGGVLSPGTTSPGILTAKGNVVFNTGSALAVALNGTAAGTGYSQLLVASGGSTINLGGSSLNVTLGFSPADGTSFRVIDNQGGGAVGGAFGNAFPVVANGSALGISYAAGDGNDVALTRLGAALAGVGVGTSPPILEGSTVTLTGSLSDPSTGDVLSLTVNWGDGSTDSFTNVARGPFSKTHPYAEEGPYSITVTASDGMGGNPTATAATQITDLPPVVAAVSTAVTASENAAAINTGTWSDFDDAVTLTADRGSLTQNGDGTWSWSGTGDENAPYTVTVTATNADGSTATTSFAVSFTDVAPTVASAAASVSAPENALASNSGTWSDFDDVVTLSADRGSLVQNGNGTWSWSGAGDESPPYTVTVTATNADGSTAATSFDVSFTDVKPTVAADSAAVSAPENTMAVNTGTWSDWDDAVTLSADHGSLVQNGAGTWSWSGTGDDDSPYTITVTATNVDGSTASTSFAVSFTDVPPVVAAASPSVSALENASATNSGTWSDFDDAVTLSADHGALVQNGDGTWTWSGTGDENAPYTVTVTATNADGSSASTSFAASFTDVPPAVAAASASVSGPLAATATNTGAWSDFDDGVTLSASTGALTQNGDGTWSWSGTVQSSPYTVTITATNSDGGTATTSFTVSSSSSLSVSGSSLAAVSEGSSTGTVPVATFTDGNSSDNTGNYSATIDWGDGTPGNPDTTAGTISYDGVHQVYTVWGSHTYLDNLPGNAPYTVGITVTRSGEPSAGATTTIQVTNVAPTGGISAPTDHFQGVAGQARTFNLTAGDPSQADQAAGFTYVINWGDGTLANPDVQTIPATAANGSGLSVNHTFTAAGNYNVSVTATDQDGAVGPAFTRTLSILIAEQQDGGLAVGGTSGNDAFAFTPGSAANSLVVTLNKKSLGTFPVTAPVQIFGGAGKNTVTVSGTGGNDNFTLNGLTATLGGFSFQANSIQGWTLNGLGGDNTLAVLSTLSTAPVTFKGGSGNNTLVGPTTGATWSITTTNGGKLTTTPATGTVSFSQVQNLVGGTGVDIFKLSAAGTVLSIDGGGGGDWLDYSSFSTGVSVDLVTGAASKVGGGNPGGVHNIQNVRGGSGNDTLTGGGGNILVGGGGSDVLTDVYSGGLASGRSLLIGGAGGDTLTAGSAGDLLIGGTTKYDTNNAALAALLAGWQSADDYATRFTKLHAGVGPGGADKLVWGSTVLDDHAADTLTGSTAGLDWFFANLGQDTLNNLNQPSSEHVNNSP
jgi:autotransporter-associated beta strand protein